jgi:hypothetical protein
LFTVALHLQTGPGDSALRAGLTFTPCALAFECAGISGGGCRARSIAWSPRWVAWRRRAGTSRWRSGCTLGAAARRAYYLDRPASWWVIAFYGSWPAGPRLSVDSGEMFLPERHPRSLNVKQQD